MVLLRRMREASPAVREAAGGAARVAVIPGDGIGVDVTREAVLCFRAAADLHGAAVDFVEWDLGAERYLRDGVTVTDDEIRRLADNYDANYSGRAWEIPGCPTPATYATSSWDSGFASTSTSISGPASCSIPVTAR